MTRVDDDVQDFLSRHETRGYIVKNALGEVLLVYTRDSFSWMMLPDDKATVFSTRQLAEEWISNINDSMSWNEMTTIIPYGLKLSPKTW
jgi:hypothetical protein